MTDSSGMIIPEKWFKMILGKGNFDEFQITLLSWAFDKLKNDYTLGALFLLMSDIDWGLMPENIDAQGNVIAQPRVPALPDEPAASDGSAADDRRYDREIKTRERIRAVRGEIFEVTRTLKVLLTNPSVVGVFHAIALGAGDDMAKLNDTPKNIFGRLKEHLGTPDADTFHMWRAVYRTPAHHLPVSEWIQQDVLANTQLTKYDEQLSARQRMNAFRECYRLSPAVMTCWSDYCKATPVLQDQNLADILTYVTLQEPNIKASLSKTDLGLHAAARPSIAATGAAAVEEDTVEQSYAAAAAPATHASAPVYSQAQMDRAIAEAVSNMRAAPADQQYCWLHGYQGTHTGLGCHFIKKGLPMRAKRGDPRVELPPTMVFDRPGCIMVEQAQEAAGPYTHPKWPGNTSKPGGKSRA
jgi:hypothetical protein